MTGIIERMARAICESVGPEGSADAKSQTGDWPAWHDWLPQASAALAAIRPEDISERMIEEAKRTMHVPSYVWSDETSKDFFRRALAAAIAAGGESHD